MPSGSTRSRPGAIGHRSSSPSRRPSEDDSQSEEIIFAGQAFSGTTRYVVGVLFLAIVNLIWVSCDILAKYIYDEDTFEKPLFITYFYTSLFSVYLVGFVLPSCRAQWKNRVWVPVDDSDHEEPEQVTERRYLLSAEHLPAMESPPPLRMAIDEVFDEDDELIQEEEEENGGVGVDSGVENGVLVIKEETSSQPNPNPEGGTAPKLRNLPMTIPLTRMIKGDSDIDSEAFDDTDPSPTMNGHQSQTGVSPACSSLPDRASSLPTSPSDTDVTGRLLIRRQRRQLRRSLSHSPTFSSQSIGMRHSSSASNVTSLRSCLKNSPSGSSLVMPAPVPVPELRTRRLSLTAPVFKPLHVRKDQEDEDLVISVSPPTSSPETEGSESTQKVLMVRHDSKVRFSMSEEVRALPAEEFADAHFARLSFEAAEQRRRIAQQMANKLKIMDIVRLAGMLMAIWFAANYFLQLALIKSSWTTVQIFSSSSSLFVLIIAAAIPSCTFERPSVTKVIVVLMCVGGAVLVGLSNTLKTAAKTPKDGEAKWNIGILYSLLGAFFYSLFVVLLKRRVGPLHHISIPIFLGFLGVWCIATVWPLVLIFHYTGVETFMLPNNVENSTHVWTYLAVNGAVGTVFSGVFWLLGVFLTSPLVGILALLFVNPIGLVYQLTKEKVKFSSEYAIGFIMILFGFTLAVWLAKKNNPDPIMNCFRSYWRRDSFTTWSVRNPLSHYWRRKQ